MQALPMQAPVAQAPVMQNLGLMQQAPGMMHAPQWQGQPQIMAHSPVMQAEALMQRHPMQSQMMQMQPFQAHSQVTLLQPQGMTQMHPFQNQNPMLLSSGKKKQQDIYDKSPTAAISTSAVWLWQLPKTRLQDLIEGICSQFDVISTSQLDVAELSMLLWLVTGTRPDTLTAHTRCSTYAELTQKMQRKHQTFTMELSPARMSAMLSSLMPLTSSRVRAMAEQCGYQEAWHQKQKKTGMPKAPSFGQLALTEMPGVRGALREHVRFGSDEATRILEWDQTQSRLQPSSAFPMHPSMRGSSELRPQNDSTFASLGQSNGQLPANSEPAQTPAAAPRQSLDGQSSSRSQTSLELAPQSQASSNAPALAHAELSSAHGLTRLQPSIISSAADEGAIAVAMPAQAAARSLGADVPVMPAPKQEVLSQEQRTLIRQRRAHALDRRAKRQRGDAPPEDLPSSSALEGEAAQDRSAEPATTHIRNDVQVVSESEAAQDRGVEPAATPVRHDIQVASESGAAQADQITCAFCQEDLRQEPTQALPCMHNFHARCLEQYTGHGIDRPTP